jgi:carboxymethylenebutenolidase
MSDLDATEAYAKSTGKADTSKLAVTGFCWAGLRPGCMPRIIRT